MLTNFMGSTTQNTLQIELILRTYSASKRRHILFSLFLLRTAIRREACLTTAYYDVISVKVVGRDCSGKMHSHTLWLLNKQHAYLLFLIVGLPTLAIAALDNQLSACTARSVDCSNIFIWGSVFWEEEWPHCENIVK